MKGVEDIPDLDSVNSDKQQKLHNKKTFSLNQLKAIGDDILLG